MSTMKELRLLRGLTQLELAQLAATSQPQIMRLETSKRTMSKQWAQRLAPHLGVTPENLLFSTSELESSMPANYHHSRLSEFGEVFDQSLINSKELLALGDMEKDLTKIAIGHCIEREEGVFIVEFGDRMRWVEKPWFIQKNISCFAIQIMSLIYHPHFWPGEYVIFTDEYAPQMGRDTLFCNKNRSINDLSMLARLLSFDDENFYVEKMDREHHGEKASLSRQQWPEAIPIVGRGG